MHTHIRIATYLPLACNCFIFKFFRRKCLHFTLIYFIIALSDSCPPCRLVLAFLPPSTHTCIQLLKRFYSVPQPFLKPFAQLPAISSKPTATDVTDYHLGGAPLGLQDGRIPDWALSAFSGTGPEVIGGSAALARLHGSECWSFVTMTPDAIAVSSWLQIDLQRFYALNGLVLQGRHDGLGFVKSFQLDWSIDNCHWETYRPSSGSVNVKGIRSAGQTAVVPFKEGIVARYVRFIPLEIEGQGGLRLELFGVLVGHTFGLSTFQLTDSNFSSSAYLGSNLPHHARLYATTSWTGCHNSDEIDGYNSSNDLTVTETSLPDYHDIYLQINLENLSFLRSVVVQGSPMHQNEYVSRFWLSWSTNGVDFEPYMLKQNGGKAIFSVPSGETHGILLPFAQPVSHVRIHPVSWFQAPSLRLELFGSCLGIPIGLQSGDIPDLALSASSSKQGYEPFMARKDGSLAWSPSSSDPQPWLQIDIGKVSNVRAIILQSQVLGLQPPSSFTIKCSYDGNNWSDVVHIRDLSVLLDSAGVKDRPYNAENQGEGMGIFKVNEREYCLILPMPPISQVHHIQEYLQQHGQGNQQRPSCMGRFLRLCPHNLGEGNDLNVALNIEVYVDILGRELGLANGNVFDFQITASSYADAASAPHLARLFGPNGWTPDSSDSNQYLQIDLEEMQAISAVLVQLQQPSVVRFALASTLDGLFWSMYEPHGKEFIFGVSTDDSLDVVPLIVQYPLVAKSVRLLIRSSSSEAFTIRVELVVLPCGSPLSAFDGSNSICEYKFSSSADTLLSTERGRLGSTLPWQPKSDDSSPWLEIDAGSIVRLTGIIVQGDISYTGIAPLRVETSLDHRHWNSIDVIVPLKHQYAPNGVLFLAGGEGDGSTVAVAGSDTFGGIELSPSTLIARFVRLSCIQGAGNVILRALLLIDRLGYDLIHDMEVYDSDAFAASSSLSIEHSPSRASSIDMIAKPSPHDMFSFLSQPASDAWIPATADNNKFLQFTVGTIKKPKLITAFLLQGCKDPKAWTTVFSLEYSLDGKLWIAYKECGLVKHFVGNADDYRTTSVPLRKPFVAGVVRFRPLRWCNFAALRVIILGRDVGKAIGLADGELNDDMLSCSSSLTPAQGAQACRLLKPDGSWRPSANDGHQFVDVNLGSVHAVVGVIVQGEPLDPGAGSGVTSVHDNADSLPNVAAVSALHLWGSYGAAQPEDGLLFSPYTHDGGNSECQVFSLPSARNFAGIVLARPLLAQYVRLQPVCWSKEGIAMRSEIYARSIGTSMELSQGRLPEQAWKASSCLSGSFAHYATLNNKLGGWCAMEPDGDDKPWLEIDLCNDHSLSALFIQGHSQAQAWTTSFTLNTSKDGQIWDEYPVNGNRQLFRGNTDAFSVVGCTLTSPVRARFIRILPNSWHNYPALRVEVFQSSTDIMPTVAVEDELRALEAETSRLSAVIGNNCTQLASMYTEFFKALVLPTGVLAVVEEMKASSISIYTEGIDTLERFISGDEELTVAVVEEEVENHMEGLEERADNLDALIADVTGQVDSVNDDIAQTMVLPSESTDKAISSNFLLRVVAAQAAIDQVTSTAAERAALHARVTRAQQIVENSLSARRNELLRLQELSMKISSVSNDTTARIGTAVKVGKGLKFRSKRGEREREEVLMIVVHGS